MGEIDDDTDPCPDCDGSGYIVCDFCDGSGRVSKEYRQQVDDYIKHLEGKDA